jgi:hypothetical protein
MDARYFAHSRLDQTPPLLAAGARQTDPEMRFEKARRALHRSEIIFAHVHFVEWGPTEIGPEDAIHRTLLA